MVARNTVSAVAIKPRVVYSKRNYHNLRNVTYNLLISLLCLGAVPSMATPSSANIQNRVAGTWRIVSAQAEVEGKIIMPFGPNPIGLLIFTEDLHFAETIVNPDVPKFASGNFATGTEAENKAAISGGLGNSGTYTVDDQGRFSSEHLISSTFPDWNGLDRDTRQITEDVRGDTMTEHLQDPGGPKITIVWQRVSESR